jgi:NAD(P)-dependent dehydrogenase (short-subunit alcohol dehydrogenase family)
VIAGDPVDGSWASEAEANDDDGLRGKVAIIAGASGPGDGMTNGRAAAVVLARAGVRMVCVGRRREQVERTAAMIKSLGGEAIAIAADATVEDDCRAAVSTAVDHFGRLDILDNNVGVAARGTVVDLPIETWRSIWTSNVESMILMSRHAIPAMVETTGGGSIINIGSLRAIRPFDVSPYSTTKGAVMALTQSMAIDHAAERIRVNCIVLGPVFTATAAQSLSPQMREVRRNASPLGIEGSAWDTGNLVRFLASDHARYITGQCLVLDGGVSLVSPKR